MHKELYVKVPVHRNPPQSTCWATVQIEYIYLCACHCTDSRKVHKGENKQTLPPTILKQYISSSHFYLKVHYDPVNSNT